MKNFIKTLFEYKPQKSKHNFSLDLSPNNIENHENINNNTLTLSSNLESNLEYLKGTFKSLISSDINLREFTINITTKQINCAVFFIDGITNTATINDFILRPLLLKNSINMKPKENTTQNTSNFCNSGKIVSIKKFDLESFIYKNLIPEANVKKEANITKIIEHINMGFTALFVDSISTCFLVETKTTNERSIAPPLTEPIIKGAHQGFVENVRTNTSLIRKIVNNENLIIENINVGKITKTNISICYMGNITNDSLVSEIKYRLNNINLDYLIFPNDLETLITDNPKSIFPQTRTTERPDKAALNILNGKVILLINNVPYAIIIPSIFVDYLSAAEDNNLNFFAANFLKLIRIVSLFCALFLPGIYVAVTSFHQELIPSELLFAIINARKSIPFPVIFEILLMEFSFELLGEASVRVSSSFSTTVGIIGALILGDAAVSANIVSPILIIIIAFTGISSFAIPDYSFKYSIRILRFLFIILGYLAGFLGIAFGTFIIFSYLSSISSFGVSYILPSTPDQESKTDTNQNNIFIKPIWQQNKRTSYLNTKKPHLEDKQNKSMNWR